jgi:alpha-1,3-rhamnosyl/mannosyltransferase
VVTVQDLIFVQHPEWTDRARGAHLRRALPRALALATKVIVTTEHMASEVLDGYPSVISREKIAVIPMGVRRFEGVEAPAEVPAEAPEEWRGAVVTYGNLEPRKDVLTLVRAHQKLSHETRRRHPLIITGNPLDGSYARAVESAVDLPLARVLPRLDDASLGGLVSRSALAVFPSLAEGFGLGPLEAFSLGAQVIASGLRVTRELLGERVRYFKPGDVGQLANLLEESLRSPERPSAADREALRERFSWERAALLHEKLFREVAGEVD